MRRFSEGEKYDQVTHRMRTVHHVLRYSQPGSICTVQCPQDTSKIVEIDSSEFKTLGNSIQDGSNVPDQLRRAICIALYDAGFTAATPQALEGFASSIREYLTYFVYLVRMSTIHCRRTKPIPQDFSYALEKHNLSPSDLLPHLQASLPTSVVLPQIQPPLPADPPPISFGTLFDGGSELSEQSRKHYIPAHFPKLPSLHTFKDTGVFSERHKDPRTIRELATKEGVLAEQALRKLMAAKKLSARAKAARVKRTPRNRHWQLSQEMWTETMEAILREDGVIGKTGRRSDIDLAGVEDTCETMPDVEAEYGTIVNYDQRYWRHGARNDAEVPW